MKQWGMKTLANKSTLLALAGILTVGIAACGGGSSGSTSAAAPVVGDAAAGNSTVSGFAAKGPLHGSTITYNGGKVSGTPSHGTYSFKTTLPSGTTAYTLAFSGGTDDVTGNTPIMDLTTLVTSVSATVNANAITSLIAAAAAANVGTGGTITQQTITTVDDAVLDYFGFGVDGVAANPATFDPFSTPVTGLTAQQAGEYALGLEAAGEMLRRVQAASASFGSMAKVIADIGTELKLGSLPTVPTNPALMNTLYLAAADVANQVINRNLTVGVNAIPLTSVATAYGTTLGTSAPNLTSTLASTSLKLVGAAKILWQTAGALLGSTSTEGAKYLSAAAALTATSTLTDLMTQIKNLSTTAINSTVLASTATQSSTAAATAAAAAGDVAVKGSTVFLNGASGKLSVRDVNSGGSTVVLSTDAPTFSGSTVTVNIPSTSTINGQNLAKLTTVKYPGDQRDPGAQAVPPSINFALTNIPVVRGTATVSLLLKDGTTATRAASERYISATYDMQYEADGKNLKLTLPANGTATVTYYQQNSTAASTLTVTNAAFDSVLVGSNGFTNQSGATVTTGTETGATGSTNEAKMEAKIFSLYNANSTLASVLNAAVTQGSYFYQIKLAGLPMGFDATGNGSLTDTGDGKFDTIQGSFTVK
ncbi:MAG: hypothetical protein H7833_01095 [Magnetococcus sp. DMHC-1]|nr:hypothetical protein [Magnetococcales bacterium]